MPCAYGAPAPFCTTGIIGFARMYGSRRTPVTIQLTSPPGLPPAIENTGAPNNPRNRGLTLTERYKSGIAAPMGVAKYLKSLLSGKKYDGREIFASPLASSVARPTYTFMTSGDSTNEW